MGTHRINGGEMRATPSIERMATGPFEDNAVLEDDAQDEIPRPARRNQNRRNPRVYTNRLQFAGDDGEAQQM